MTFEESNGELQPARRRRAGGKVGSSAAGPKPGRTSFSVKLAGLAFAPHDPYKSVQLLEECTVVAVEIFDLFHTFSWRPIEHGFIRHEDLASLREISKRLRQLNVSPDEAGVQFEAPDDFPECILLRVYPRPATEPLDENARVSFKFYALLKANLPNRLRALVVFLEEMIK
jgi:hypothetical protein